MLLLAMCTIDLNQASGTIVIVTVHFAIVEARQLLLTDTVAQNIGTMLYSRHKKAKFDAGRGEVELTKFV